MKVKVVRNWADASNAWIDVQTYTGLKLPPPGMQYKLSFMDKDSVPAQMIVTSDGVSWVDGLGGGYKGKTVLDMTIEEPQRGSESGVGSGGGGVAFDGVTLANLQNEDDCYFYNITLTLNGDPITSDVFFMAYIEERDTGSILSNTYATIDSDGDYLSYGIVSQPENWLYIMRYSPGGEAYIAINFIQSFTARICIVMPSGLIFKSEYLPPN